MPALGAADAGSIDVPLAKDAGRQMVLLEAVLIPLRICRGRESRLWKDQMAGRDISALSLVRPSVRIIDWVPTDA